MRKQMQKRMLVFFFQAEDGIRDGHVTGVQTCALPICERQRQLAAAIGQLQAAEGAPGPEYGNAAPMTAAQRNAIYGASPNAPQRTSSVSEAQAEAKQKVLAREKQKQDAINSGTVAIDFAHRTETATTPPTTAVLAEREEPHLSAKTEEVAADGTPPQKTVSAPVSPDQPVKANASADPMSSYSF